jgi:hypothetical protein
VEDGLAFLMLGAPLYEKLLEMLEVVLLDGELYLLEGWLR